MISHPNRNPAIRARNRYFEAEHNWTLEYLRLCETDPHDPPVTGEPGSELYRLHTEMVRARAEYYRHVIPAREP